MAPETTEVLGSIVAFEGRPDTISTQLRLLPASAQVLILPSVRCYISDDNLDQGFDARLYVRQVHDALVTRNDAARAFLQGSTQNSKRLVFINGGTPSAQALCIKAIMKHETHGSKAEAGAIFDDLIKDGLAGLESPVGAHQNRNTFGYTTAEEARFEDPITRAMRAADALDRQTANLQPSNDLDLTITRPRSLSLPMYGYSDEFGDAAPFFVFGVTAADDADDSVEESANSPMAPSTPMTPSLAIMKFHEKPPKPMCLHQRTSVSTVYSSSCVGEPYESDVSQRHVKAEAAALVADDISVGTLDHVVYGEASLLAFRRPGSKCSVPRVRSLDRIYPASSKFRDLGIPSSCWLSEPDSPRLQRPLSLTSHAGERDDTMTRLSSVGHARTVAVRSRFPAVKVAPVPQDRKAKNKPPTAETTYVDRGTDARADSNEKAPFQPVFSCTEDLLVYFKERTPDGVLESAVNAFKDGRYPPLSHSPTASEPDVADGFVPGTPESTASEAAAHTTTPSEELTVVPMSANVDEYDPFTYMQPTLQPPKTLPVALKVTIVRPPTPARTPSSSINMVEYEHKYHEFTITPNQTAVAVQNSLRSILGGYFPPDTQGYHQFQFSLLPELEGLWKPIFCTTRPNGSQNGENKLNQVLAIGSQKGVKKEYSSAIMGHLERLGSESSGFERADRLDFRYLLANAMQAFTAQPLANQTSDNPFTNSYLLATLLVPQLETYLALHSEIRYLLLQYPPEHLPTVLALQKLLGMDLMKVAQIVDSDSNEHLPFTHIRGASISSKSEETQATTRRATSPISCSDVPVSKANYLLTSTASDMDIAKFVSTVWNIQTEAPGFALRDSTPSQDSNRKAQRSALRLRRDSLSPFPRVSPPNLVSPKTKSSLPPLPPTPDSPTSMRRPSSRAETLKTVRSAKSRRSRSKPRTNAQVPSDAISMMTFDPNDDSDYDMEERRLMPLFMKKPRARKPNSRKAFEFLGLA